jgi:hypothetical protein
VIPAALRGLQDIGALVIPVRRTGFDVYDNFNTPPYIILSPSYGIAPSGESTGSSATYALCAERRNLLSSPVPAAAAFHAISTDGEALLTAPLAPTFKIVCRPGCDALGPPGYAGERTSLVR